MHFNKLFSALFLGILLLFNACNESTTGGEDNISDVEIQQVQDLEASGENPHYTFYNLRKGTEVEWSDSASANWDIAFRGTSIILNSGISGPGEAGALGLDVAFDNVEIAPTEGYRMDTDSSLAIPTGSGNGWYIYTANANPPHAILPKENYTIIVKTADGNHYAKVEIQSYYEGNPDTSSETFANPGTRSSSGYYTFRYAIQNTEGLRELK